MGRDGGMVVREVMSTHNIRRKQFGNRVSGAVADGVGISILPPLLPPFYPPPPPHNGAFTTNDKSFHRDAPSPFSLLLRGMCKS